MTTDTEIKKEDIQNEINNTIMLLIELTNKKIELQNKKLNIVFGGIIALWICMLIMGFVVFG